MMLCILVAGGGLVTKELLQNLLGCYVQAFVFRRECMSCAHHIYSFIENLPPGVVVQLPSPLRDEIFSMALCLGLAQAWVRDPVDTEISATDATPSRGGRTRAHVTAEFSASLYRLGEQWGESGRLDWTAEEEASLPSKMVRAGTELERVIECLDWRVAGDWSFTQSSHINLSELRALKGELRALALDPTRHRHRRIVLLDSRVVVGATAKGRSSSFKLNGLLRSCLGYTLGPRISLGLIWINTHINPADHPSRSRPLPPPPPLPGYDLDCVRPYHKKLLGCTVMGSPFQGGLISGLRRCGWTALCRSFEETPDNCDKAVAAVRASKSFAFLVLGCFTSFDRKATPKIRGGLRGDILSRASGPGCTVALKEDETVERLSLLLQAALQRGRLVLVLQPRDSWIWRRPSIQALSDRFNLAEYLFDHCAFGGPGRASTRLLTNLDSVESLGRSCPGNHIHPPGRPRSGLPPDFIQLLCDGMRAWHRARFR
jgi:hypothetical protein